ncbi:ABC transporter permease [Flavilitoribacter nigricans]|uniref:Transporter permease n=1 Tax=Flavilitoribacter nigricans (strain ATCC 23147 / DSM 23189 / NBRC 102662 / NCIMB 1420 / SS-2) TaxID=1122177 RepID=A0A2D0N9H2_FLAN2|nr:ABC transporter permease [Flavilitoribacter nigricans]PHN05171.1 transporter permease [Flavilitoribacter nigricans DSM 23189 = NBRC 102662]
MLQHALLLAFRHFKRYRGSFLINLTGLAAGLTCAILIFLWVNDERQMDQFHTLDDRLYRLISDSHSNETVLNTSITVVERLQEEMPEIETVVNSSWGALESSLANGVEEFALTGEFATPDFFRIFSYPLLQGAPDQVLEQPHSIVLSEATARKLFHTTDVVGKTVRWRWFSHEEEVEITGVFAGTPANSSEQFDYVLSFDVFESYFRERIDRGNYLARTYLTLRAGADPAQLNRKISAFMQREYPEGSWRPFVIPYASFYLHNTYEDGEAVGGRMAYVRLFSIIALLVLTIACINFMNLSTARASRRMKEIGIKKTIGASRRSLIFQHFMESILLSSLAGILALITAALLLPQFNQLTGKTLALFADLQFLPVFIGIVLATGIVAGSYPAFYLSSFKPTMIIKGKLEATFGEQWLRRGLVVFQFGISMILVAAVLVVHRQMDFMQNKNLGYRQDQILTFSTNGLQAENQQLLLSRLREIPGVTEASSITHALVGGQASNANLQWEGKAPESTIWFEHGYVNYGMMEMLDVDLISGRFFSEARGDETNKLVINETAAGVMGFPDPVGKTVRIAETEYEIIGVTRDFHFESLHELVKPTYFRLNDRWALKIAVKIDAGRERETLADIEGLYQTFDSGFPFAFTFMSEDYQQQYVAEKRVSTLSRYFAGLAVLISCLGLVALASFTAERRIKEIGIRKIMGASTRGIVWLLSADFTRIVLVAIVLAVPLGIWLSATWLDTFAYRIELEWWIFAGSGALMLLIAWLSVGYQTLRAAQMNPVGCLQE